MSRTTLRTMTFTGLVAATALFAGTASAEDFGTFPADYGRETAPYNSNSRYSVPRNNAGNRYHNDRYGNDTFSDFPADNYRSDRYSPLPSGSGYDRPRYDSLPLPPSTGSGLSPAERDRLREFHGGDSQPTWSEPRDDYRRDDYRRDDYRRDDYRRDDYRRDDYRRDDYRQDDTQSRRPRRLHERRDDRLPARDQYNSPGNDRRDNRYDDRYDSRYDDLYDTRYRPQPQNDYGRDLDLGRLLPPTPNYDNGLPQYTPVTPAGPRHPEDAMSETEKIQARLAYRYGNPTVTRFAQSTSAQQLLSLYAEASQMIDARHLEPADYQARIEQGLRNLSLAVENQTFLRANNISPGTTQVRTFQSALTNVAATRQSRNLQEAAATVQYVASMASQQIGLSPQTTIMEFVYAATESLDKYSTFLPEAGPNAPSVSLEDHVVGIGVELKPHDRGAEVVSALRNSPAEQAGLQKGDLIVAVDGVTLSGRTLDFVVDRIGGAIGTQLQLAVVRGSRSPATVTLTRSRVRVYTVNDVRMIDTQNKVGYLRLSKFAEASADELDQALWQLHREGMKSLVFDVRGNPGGLLTSAIDISNRFLHSGTIVSTRGRTSADNMAESATFEQTWSVPLVVLVDKNSASASEIFAAAIQENNRGLVVGQRSYGKGTVQTHFPLRSVSGTLKLTTAKFYSPGGRVMAGAGVTPDVPVQEARSGNVSAGYDADVEAALSLTQSSRLLELARNGHQNRSGAGLLNR